MEEAQISADGVTHSLPHPFLVIATENNIEAQGTFPLPEAQLDRFMIKMRIGYPEKHDEADILAMQTGSHPLDQIHPILSAEEIVMLQSLVRTVYVAPELRHYIVDIVSSTRDHPNIQLGSSPRGSLALLHSSQALAALRGRTYVIVDDIKELTVPVLSHRMILRPESRLKFADPVRILEDILSSTRTPDAV
jgi:MoxR-like ATPase